MKHFVFVITVALLTSCLLRASDYPTITLKNRDSLATAGDFVHTEIAPAGKAIAQDVYDILSKGDVNNNLMKIAELAKKCENFSADKVAHREILAIGWILGVIASGEPEKMFRSPLEKAYFIFFTEDNYSRLKTYLLAQHKLSGYETMDPEKLMMNLNMLQNALIYNSPSRVRWEEVDKIIKLCRIKKGESVVDFGCRQGYYAWRFLDLVGEDGMVYCLDNDRGHIDFLQKFILETDLPNMLATKSTNESIGLVSNRADVIFVNQLYHLIYIYTPRLEQRKLLTSIKKALRKGGRLIILDTNPVKGVSGYTLDSDLIVAQLHHYGFKLQRKEQITPLVYFLEFVNEK